MRVCARQGLGRAGCSATVPLALEREGEGEGDRAGDQGTSMRRGWGQGVSDEWWRKMGKQRQKQKPGMWQQKKTVSDEETGL